MIALACWWAAVFTDDHAEYLSGAKAAGMRTILFKDLDDFKQRFAEIER